MKIIVLEGARGAGKSSVSFKLRQSIPSATYINFTGFKDDGRDGLLKIQEYYFEWMRLFKSLTTHDSTYILDRFYFSEQVYSQLYKEYSFEAVYRALNEGLVFLSQHADINIFFLKVSDNDILEQRLKRDKIPFANVEESVSQSIIQQNMYTDLFKELKDRLNVTEIDTSNKTIDEIYDEIVETI